MKTSLCGCLGLACVLMVSRWASACGTDPTVFRALSEKPEIAAPAIEKLRASGAAGVARLVDARETCAADATPEMSAEARQKLNDRLARFDRVIDEVGGARYCSVSKLYWYTDLEAAKKIAEQQHKPILSLRMLGKLTDEYSCANSRFFRTTLYSNKEIGEFLRAHYILHWESIRPVPKITIDFGDGRTLERTITGNSAHYLLAADGRPLDVLPGLYGPQAFLAWLQGSEKLAQAYAAQADNLALRETVLRQYHAAQSQETLRRWEADLRRVAPERLAIAVSPEAVAVLAPTVNNSQPVGPSASAAVPPAQAAAPMRTVVAAAPPAGKAAIRAIGKGAIEVPLLRAMAYDVPQLEAASDETVWQKIAALHLGESRLDQAATAIIRDENPAAASAGARAITKRRVEDPLVRMVRNLETSIALDAVRNEYLLHRQLHDWFAAGDISTLNLRTLNERVYAELFLTPSSDPWLGLAPADTYTALERGGLRAAAANASNVAPAPTIPQGE